MNSNIEFYSQMKKNREKTNKITFHVSPVKVLSFVRFTLHSEDVNWRQQKNIPIVCPKEASENCGILRRNFLLSLIGKSE